MNRVNRFEEFLWENGVFHEFKENFNLSMSLAEYFENGSGLAVEKFLVSGAFIWSSTPQGHDFWEDIESKWIEEIGKSEVRSD